jgi:biopolymer transport protein ExbB
MSAALLLANAQLAGLPMDRGPLDWFRATGIIGYVLLLLGVVGLVVAVRRHLEMRAARLAPEPLQKALEIAIRERQVDAAAAQSAASGTLLGTLVAAGLALRAGGLDEMLANVERTTARETMRLGNRVAHLARLGGSVLLIGFFGTTEAVISVCSVIGSLKAPVPSDFYIGVAEALCCLALALLIAFACFVAFFLLDSRLTRRTIEVREIAEEIVHSAARVG